MHRTRADHTLLWCAVFLILVLLAALYWAPKAHSADEPELVMLCFTQRSCSQCPLQRETWKKIKGVRITFVDCDLEPEMVKAWKIHRTPTTVVILADKDGTSREQSRSTGLTGREFLQTAVNTARR